MPKTWQPLPSIGSTSYGSRSRHSSPPNGKPTMLAAVKMIQDLHDLAARREQLAIFAPRLQELRARHAKKVSLLERLDHAPLT